MCFPRMTEYTGTVVRNRYTVPPVKQTGNRYTGINHRIYSQGLQAFGKFFYTHHGLSEEIWIRVSRGHDPTCYISVVGVEDTSERMSEGCS